MGAPEPSTRDNLKKNSDGPFSGNQGNKGRQFRLALPRGDYCDDADLKTSSVPTIQYQPTR